MAGRGAKRPGDRRAAVGAGPDTGRIHAPPARLDREHHRLTLDRPAQVIDHANHQGLAQRRPGRRVLSVAALDRDRRRLVLVGQDDAPAARGRGGGEPHCDDERQLPGRGHGIVR